MKRKTWMTAAAVMTVAGAAWAQEATRDPADLNMDFHVSAMEVREYAAQIGDTGAMAGSRMGAEVATGTAAQQGEVRGQASPMMHREGDAFRPDPGLIGGGSGDGNDGGAGQ